MITVLVGVCKTVSPLAPQSVDSTFFRSVSYRTSMQPMSFLNGADDGVCGACGVALVCKPVYGYRRSDSQDSQLKEEAFVLPRSRRTK
jgi:hypothetical protein